MHSFLIAVVYVISIGTETIISAGSQTNILDRDGRISGVSDKEDRDFILGAILPIHVSKGGKCLGNILVEAAEFVDAFSYSIDLVNNDQNILPNITLGFDLRDSCLAASSTIEQCVDLVLLNNPETFFMCSQILNETTPPVSAIIGEYVSSVSVPLATFLQPFHVPLISFSATSTILSNREQYGTFYRSIPSDDQQAQAMIDLVLHFGWTYVSTIHSNDLYGEPGIDAFMNLASKNGICIDLDIGINVDFSNAQYINTVIQIYNSTANVIIFFSSLEQAKQLFDHLQEYTMQLETTKRRTFLWIASDAWIESPEIQLFYGDIISGMWGIIPTSGMESGFYKYFSQLTVSTSLNPWFSEFYEFYYKCNNESKQCSNMSLASHPEYRNNSVTPLLIDAVFMFAHSLNRFLYDNCEIPIIWNSTDRTCKGQRSVLNGLELNMYLKNISFASPTGNNVELDSTGSTQGKYRILNYQSFSDDPYKLVDAGEWDGSQVDILKKLQIKQDIRLQFGINVDGSPRNWLQSQCQQCPAGYIRNPLDLSCCGSCSPCLGQNFTSFNNSLACSICPLYSWGNNPLAGSESCQSLSVSYLNPSDVWAIILVINACLGLLAVIFVTVVFGCYWKTPIVKSSGREQMLILLFGIALCFLSTIFFILKPSLPVCLLRRVFLWLCFSLIICALFVKLVRIARIFLNKNLSRRPKFLEPVYQVIFTFALVGLQMILVVVSLVVIHPDVETRLRLNSDDTNNVPQLILDCRLPHAAIIIVQALYFSIMIIVSNALAMLTIRFPANFKEVRYVAFSTFSVGIIWIAFIVMYVSTTGQFQTATILLAIQTSGFAVLICMFGHRIFIMILKPQKNIPTQTTLVTSAVPRIDRRASNQQT